MNELIKQAAEDCHLKHGIGKTGGYYSIIVNHFLSFAKDKGFELVNEVDLEITKMKWLNAGITEGASKERERAYLEGKRDGFIEGYTGTPEVLIQDVIAKERERMGKLMERVGKIGDWTYNCDSKKWMMLHGKEESVWTYIFKTTSELIEIFNTQNNEG